MLSRPLHLHRCQAEGQSRQVHLSLVGVSALIALLEDISSPLLPVVLRLWGARMPCPWSITAIHNKVEVKVDAAVSDDNVRIGIRGVDGVLTSPNRPMHTARQFEAQLAVLDRTTIIRADYTIAIAKITRLIERGDEDVADGVENLSTKAQTGKEGTPGVTGNGPSGPPLPASRVSGEQRGDPQACTFTLSFISSIRSVQPHAEINQRQIISVDRYS